MESIDEILAAIPRLELTELHRIIEAANKRCFEIIDAYREVREDPDEMQDTTAIKEHPTATWSRLVHKWRTESLEWGDPVERVRMERLLKKAVEDKNWEEADRLDQILGGW